MLDAATNLEDLRALQGNRLEALHGAREGLFSIRINLPWRICFGAIEKLPTREISPKPPQSPSQGHFESARRK